MKMSEIKEKTLPELQNAGRDLRQEMFNLRLQQASAQLEKPARLRSIRKDVARVETQISALRQKAVKSATVKPAPAKTAKSAKAGK